ncbi:MAG: hypothetical protein BGO41_08050 [Clostridiales bacterium 38-18]|nr:MAG: hypothetical protein BGO41_08050 [Clostridiales bacterium 38-18]
MKKMENILILIFVGIAVILSVVWLIPYKAQEVNVLSESKLVLYEGPKSLKTATEADLKATSEQLRPFDLMKSGNTFLDVNGQSCFVYETNVNHTRQWVSTYMPPISRTPIAYFDFEGRARLKITVPDITLSEVAISPLKYDIQPEVDVENHTVTFDITEPDTYTLTFNASPDRAFHIFANPLESEMPNLEDPNVIYIGPGEWQVDTIDLKDNQTLYLAGGAVLHGTVQANFAKNVKVMGRGIIDGSFYEGWKGKVAYIPLKFDNSDGVSISDIIVLNSNAWVCQAFQSKNGTIDGLKIISPRPNGDGITLQSCEDFKVSNVFVRTWDDSLVIKNYGTNSRNISFESCQLWTDLAQSMEIGYETNKGNLTGSEISQISFRDITVLNNFHKPVISIHNGDDAVVHDIVFSNITIENAQMGSGDGDEMPYLIDFHIGQSSNWSTTKARGIIKDVLVENVAVLNGKFNDSRIQGFDATHKVENVTIRNLTILGQAIKDGDTGRFMIDDTTTTNIKFE